MSETEELEMDKFDRQDLVDEYRYLSSKWFKTRKIKRRMDVIMLDLLRYDIDRWNRDATVTNRRG